MNTQNEYSAEELTILREIYGSNETIESQLHRLPRRTAYSVDAKAHALGLVKARSASTISRIHDLMADGKPRTIREVHKAVGGRRKYVAEQLRIRANGVDYHIHSYIGVHRCYVFKAGPGENAVRPPPANLPAKVYSARWRERHLDARPMKAMAKPGNQPVAFSLAQVKPAPKVEAKPKRPEYDPALERLKDEKYRLPAEQRRLCDNLVFDAISAMARVGRQAA